MTKEEVYSRMQVVADNLAEYTQSQKELALNFIRTHMAQIKTFNLRTLLFVLKILKANPTQWEDLAKYAVTQG